jgi:dihydropteroate synthase
MNKIHNLLNKNSKPLIMGILNITPDSFSDGGKFNDLDNALRHVEDMIKHGADIIDIGAESTRPGAKEVSLEKELFRLEPILKKLKQEFSIPISVDTYKPDVMKLAIAHKVDMINDIYALQKPGALEVISKSNIFVCLMHMKGSPKSMQKNPHYSNTVKEVKSFIKKRIKACEDIGINKERIIIDPGFGFGKSHEHNTDLFKSLKSFNNFSLPILIGVSRKSMVKKMVGDNEDDIIQASAILGMIAVMAGIKIIRTHDVKKTTDIFEILKHIQS